MQGNIEKEMRQIRLWIDEELFYRLEQQRIKEKKINDDVRTFSMELIKEALELREKSKLTKTK